MVAAHGTAELPVSLFQRGERSWGSVRLTARGPSQYRTSGRPSSRSFCPRSNLALSKRDRYLIDPVPSLCNPSRDLGFDTEASLFEIKAFQDFAPKGFVAAFHVEEIEVRHEI
jgi:hypothetical protein